MVAIAARYALDTFTIQLASGASLMVIKGSVRDSAHGAVTGNPNAWGTTPLVAGTQISALLAAHLVAHPTAEA